MNKYSVIALSVVSFLFMGNIQAQRALQITKVADWFQVREIRSNLFFVYEPSDGGFYVLKSNDKALLIDGGFGMSEKLSNAILSHLGIKQFDLLITHAHVDHVGLASKAKNVYVHKLEWERFVSRKEGKSISFYYEALKDEVAWPMQLNGKVPTQKKWKPNKFIDSGEIFQLGPWKVEAVRLPGHTAGHLGFYEKEQGLLFLGDHLYDGALYLHLPDSSLVSFDKSLAWVEAKLKTTKGKLLLLPAHNSVPLDQGYVARVREVLEKIKRGQIAPASEDKESHFFIGSRTYKEDGVEISIGMEDLKKNTVFKR